MLNCFTVYRSECVCLLVCAQLVNLYMQMCDRERSASQTQRTSASREMRELGSGS